MRYVVTLVVVSSVLVIHVMASLGNVLPSPSFVSMHHVGVWDPVGRAYLLYVAIDPAQCLTNMMQRHSHSSLPSSSQLFSFDPRISIMSHWAMKHDNRAQLFRRLSILPTHHTWACRWIFNRRRPTYLRQASIGVTWTLEELVFGAFLVERNGDDSY